jgi:hypothetical protein
MTTNPKDVYPDFIQPHHMKSATWRNARWTVSFTVLPNMLIDSVQVTAIVGATLLAPEATHTLEYPLTPFDELRTIVIAKMVDAALIAKEKQALSEIPPTPDR